MLPWIKLNKLITFLPLRFSRRLWPVWLDLAKFRHSLKSWAFLGAFIHYLAKFWNYFGNGQMLKNNLAIWSHWLWPTSLDEPQSIDIRYSDSQVGIDSIYWAKYCCGNILLQDLLKVCNDLFLYFLCPVLLKLNKLFLQKNTFFSRRWLTVILGNHGSLGEKNMTRAIFCPIDQHIEGQKQLLSLDAGK